MVEEGLQGCYKQGTKAIGVGYPKLSVLWLCGLLARREAAAKGRLTVDG
jgi:hypothetical protein